MADQVHAHVGQDVRDHERMHHVGLAGIAGLPLVLFGGEAEGLLEGRQIVARAVLPHLGFQLAKSLSTERFRRRGGRQTRAPGSGEMPTLVGSEGHDLIVEGRTGHCPRKPGLALLLTGR